MEGAARTEVMAAPEKEDGRETARPEKVLTKATILLGNCMSEGETVQKAEESEAAMVDAGAMRWAVGRWIYSRQKGYCEARDQIWIDIGDRDCGGGSGGDSGRKRAVPMHWIGGWRKIGRLVVSNGKTVN